MREGLLWYDPDARRPACQKIDDAARRYEERFKQAPNCCHVHPSEQATHPRLHVVADERLRPHHYWAGIDGSLRPARADARRGTMAIWAFIADVHGNFRALERAERLARAHGATRFVALGDLLGRGQPAECVAWVRAHAALAVVGNRDLDHLALVDDAARAFLRGLPRRASAADFLVSHGDAKLDAALNSADERRGFRRVYAELTAAGQRLWFFGHTHHARVWRKPALDAPPEPLPAARVTLDATPGVRYIVNVGATGRRLAGRGPTAITLYDADDNYLQRLEL